MNSILRTHATNYSPKTCQTVKSFPKKPFNNNSRNNALHNPASHFNSFLFPSYTPSDSRKLNNSTKTRKSVITSEENKENMADVQHHPAPQQFRRPKLRRKGTNKASSVSKVTAESVLPPETPTTDVDMNLTDHSENSALAEIPHNTSKANSYSRDAGTTPNRTRNKKSFPQLQQKPTLQDSQQNQSNSQQGPQFKQSPPKSSRTNPKTYINDYSFPPSANQQSANLNGSNSQKRRGRRNKQQSTSALNSTNLGHSGSSGDETSPGTGSSGLPPRPKSQHIRTESTPKPTLQRRLSSPEIPLSPQPLTPQKPTFYAGACFEKSPAPSALPIPSFTSRQLSLASSLPTQSHARAATTDSRPQASNEHKIHPSTSTPLLHLAFDPMFASPDIYSTPVTNRSNVPRYTSTPPAQIRAYDKTPEIFSMDEDEKCKDKELRKRSRDLLTLLGAAKDLPDIYTHDDNSQWTQQKEWVDNGIVLEQIGRNLKDLLKIQC